MATFIVNTNGDGGAGSLRAAIDAANGNGAGADVIAFDAALAGQTITLGSSLPQIAGDVTIDGSGAAGITIDGSDHRVFWASSGVIAIEELSISNGRAAGGAGGGGYGGGGGGAGLGGGLFVDQDADVTLRGVTFAGNEAVGGAPGGFAAGFAGGGGGGMDADGADGPDGGDGGGPAGGAGGGNSHGTAGGDFSGGGGAGFAPTFGFMPNAGAGGFGGGGGGAGASGGAVGGPGAPGGFGGGGGGGQNGGVSGGYGGVAGTSGGGGAGAGLGGAVFVRDGGQITLEDVSFGADNRAVGGNGPVDGSAEGGALFLMGGGLLEYDVTAGETRTLAATVDTAAATLILVKGGGGTLVLDAAHDASQILINEGVLSAAAGRLPSGGALVSNVEIDAGAVLQIAHPTDAAWAGVVAGVGDLVKSGAGVLTLTGYALHTGSTTVSQGTLRVNGEVSSSSTSIESGARLEGTGHVGSLSVLSGGTLAPGASPGVLNSGDLTLTAGATFEAELAGTGAGQFDRVNVTGAVSLGGATLDIAPFGGFTPVAGNSFLLIDNDGVDAVVGTFAGFAQGVAVTIGSLNYTVSYTGGTGNDVTLTVSAIPPPPPRPGPTAGDDGDDVAFLGAGDNAYSGGAGSDLIHGGDGADVLHGNMGADEVYGGSGHDLLYGGKDDDALDGGLGNDVLYGDLGDDRLSGAWGDDLVHGGAGNDRADGGDGNDTVRGGQGDDVITGGAGDDWLSGDLGNDTLTGGTGADTFHIFTGAGADLVTDFSAAEGDRVQLLPGADYSVSQVGADTLVTLTGGQLVLQNVQLSSLSEGWIVGA